MDWRLAFEMFTRPCEHFQEKYKKFKYEHFQEKQPCELFQEKYDQFKYENFQEKFGKFTRPCGLLQEKYDKFKRPCEF